MKRLAVCPGSYDPVTLGHVDLVLRAKELFGEVEVVVMNNREKHYLFSLEERYELCKAAFEGVKGVRVFFSDGMLYEYLSEKEGAVLVKGIRNGTDFLYEKKMACFNREKCGVETVYFAADENLLSLSSTKVRQKMKNKEDISHLVPENVIKLLNNKL